MLRELSHILQTTSCLSTVLSPNATVRLAALLVHTPEVLGSGLILDTDILPVPLH